MKQLLPSITKVVEAAKTAKASDKQVEDEEAIKEEEKQVYFCLYRIVKCCCTS
jgi:hypothetical protein